MEGAIYSEGLPPFICTATRTPPCSRTKGWEGRVSAFLEYLFPSFISYMPKLLPVHENVTKIRLKNNRFHESIHQKGYFGNIEKSRFW